ncbi:MAG: FAS1-like dehydratase domain-containing protein [Candidatus Binatia bacterium]
MSYEAAAPMAEGQITAEMLAAMRAQIGQTLNVDESVYNEEATRLAIAKFASGIGDPNPLWTDAEYARSTRYGGIVAPPSWIICVFCGLPPGWPGLGSFHNESIIEFYKPVRLNDRILTDCVYDGFDGPKASSFAERIVIDHCTSRYHNQHGEMVARIKWSIINFERARARQQGKESAVQLPHPWTDEDIQAIDEHVLAEKPRGAVPRWWDDVQPGNELEPVIKGPCGVTDMVAFAAACGGPTPRIAAHGVALRDYRKHPTWAFRHPTTRAVEPVYAAHYDKQAANAMGVPFPYDVGFQRQCWHIHLLTNWIGDDGWIKRTNAQYRRFVYLSDVITLRGTVRKKYIDDDGEPCVDVSTTAFNQRGEDVMPGQATIVLPSRELGTSPLDRRL